jgi:5-methylcytosine-specific restriction enzyme A
MRKRRTAAARLRIFLEHKGICHVCGGRIGVTDAWDLDHVIPIALGGEDEEANLAPAHRKGCHGTKTAKEDVPNIARAKRREQRHAGIRKQTANPLPGSRNSNIKKKMDGTVVYRDTGLPVR